MTWASGIEGSVQPTGGTQVEFVESKTTGSVGLPQEMRTSRFLSASSMESGSKLLGIKGKLLHTPSPRRHTPLLPFTVHGVFTFDGSALSMQAALPGQSFLSERWQTLLGMHGGSGSARQFPLPSH
jgi:hypothetical protein